MEQAKRMRGAKEAGSAPVERKRAPKVREMRGKRRAGMRGKREAAAI